MTHLLLICVIAAIRGEISGLLLDPQLSACQGGIVGAEAEGAENQRTAETAKATEPWDRAAEAFFRVGLFGIENAWAGPLRGIESRYRVLPHDVFRRGHLKNDAV